MSDSRRDFIKYTGAAVAASTIHQTLLAQTASAQSAPAAGQSTSTGEIPRRPLGKTGLEVSALGLGGFHLARSKVESEAIRIVQEAVDAGITFLDNAWEYHDGKSEEWMGKALVGRRDKVFLMTKVCTHGRGKDVAMKQLEESLKRLKTDHLDLWQVHECVYYNDPKNHFATGGVIEALDQAKKEGKVRFVGFTGHKDPTIHLEMLSHDFQFDTVQMPLNCFDASFKSFEQNVLPEAVRRGIAPIGMKSLGGAADMVTKGAVTVEEALRYAMSLPVATTISGIPSLGVLHQNLGIVRGFKPMIQQEMQDLRARCAPQAGDGRFELYKTTAKYDAKEGRQQHGFPSKEEEMAS